MPRKTVDYNKSQRLLLVRRAVDHLGEATVSTIATWFENNYPFGDVSPTARTRMRKNLERRIYEDLNDLIQIREIESHPSSERQGNVFTIFGREKTAAGINILKGNLCDLITPSKATIGWQVADTEKLIPEYSHIRILLAEFHRPIVITLEEEELPITIVVGRTFDPVRLKLAPDFDKRFGRRSSYLALPFSNLSLENKPKTYGHTAITISADKSILVEDLGGADSTRFCQLSTEQVRLLYGMMYGQIAVSHRTYWYQENIEKLPMEALKNSSIKSDFPLAISTGRQPTIVITDSNVPSYSETKDEIGVWYVQNRENGCSPDISVGLGTYFSLSDPTKRRAA